MSIAVSDLIWKRSRHKGSNLLTLLALADWAADDGTSIYPSLETLAQKTRMTKRQTRSIVRTLEASDVLVWTGAHRNRVRVYRIALEAVGEEKISSYGDREKISAYERKRKPTSAYKRKPASANPSSDPSVREREDGEPMKARAAVAPQGAPAGIKSQPKPKTERQAERVEDAQKREPAILVYAQTFRQQPNAAQRLAILREVTDVPKWGAVCQRWAVKGYKPGSVDKMLEVYEHGWRDAPGTNGTQPSGKQATVSEGRDGSVTITYE